MNPEATKWNPGGYDTANGLLLPYYQLPCELQQQPIFSRRRLSHWLALAAGYGSGGGVLAAAGALLHGLSVDSADSVTGKAHQFIPKLLPQLQHA